MPSFRRQVENYDKWEIREFAKVKELSDSLGDALYPKMPDLSDLVIGKDAAWKLQDAAMKSNKDAIAYLALAFNNIKLFRLVTMAKSGGCPEDEAWKVMQFLTKNYHPNDLQANVELKKRPGNLKLYFEQDPSDLFEELAYIEREFVQTKAKITEIYVI